MRLKLFVLSLEQEEREQFAADVGCSLGHLQNVMYGYKPCAPELATSIEKEVPKYRPHQTVKRWDLIPDRWHRIWPEIIGFDGAPEVSSAANTTPFNEERRA